MKEALHFARSVDFAALASFWGFSIAAVWAARYSMLRPAACRLAFWCPVAGIAAATAHVAILPLQTAAMLDETIAQLAVQDVFAIVMQTRFGNVWLLQTLALSLGLLARALGLLGLLSAVLGLAALALAPLAGHVFAGDRNLPTMIANLLHVTVAAAWFGALPALLVLAVSVGKPGLIFALSTFSRVALPAMFCLLATGLILVIATVGSWPALFGTSYGHILLVKLSLLLCVLTVAGSLRSGLHRNGEQPDPPWFRRALSLEVVVASGVVAVAMLLAQTVPGRHELVDWPFSFRIAPMVASRASEARHAYLGIAFAIAAIGGGVGIAAYVHGRYRTAAVFTIASLSLAAIVALPSAMVEAYPTTYRRSPIAFEAHNIAAAATLFARHCSACHGRTGRGDGPAAPGLKPRPANLAEPHAADHTSGDMYWWLTYGKPPSAMPGFERALDEADRWGLVQYVWALSLGYQARILGNRVVPSQPWLPAIDIRLEEIGAEGLLNPRGRSAKLIVFVNARKELPRFDVLLAGAEDIGRENGVIIAVVPPELVAFIGHPKVANAWRLLVDTDKSIADGWSLYRRTLEHPDFDNELNHPDRIEFLVDRFGFVRARWRSDEVEALNDIPGIVDQIRKLNTEPEIRQENDHVH